jgi:hypothetical protein
VGAVLLVALTVGGVVFVRAVRTASQAEMNLHATLFAISLVEQFVAEHGRWPRSWEELEGLSVPGDPPMPRQGDRTVVRIGGQHGYDWPAAAPRIRARVVIDFDADPAAIAAQDPAAFTAVRPNGPCYEYLHYGYVESLQATIRKAGQKPAGAGR